LSPGKARAFRGLDGVSVATGVSDEALRDAYRRASVLVLPLLDSTSNNALVESMACGLPVVSNDVGGTRDYCDSSHSILVPSGDVDGFCKAIVRLAADQGVRRRMSARARRRAAAEFDWKVVAAEVRRVYRQVLG
jgi:glycosyltransferase involved in cell wall biosynthesis